MLKIHKDLEQNPVTDWYVSDCYNPKKLVTETEQAGETIGRAIAEAKADNPFALILFPDGLTCNMKQIFERIENTCKKPIPIIGGTSGDNWKFSKTYQYHNDKVLSDALSAPSASISPKPRL